jgi:preprotein translocase subunit SecY
VAKGKIPINYARKMQGRKMYAAQSSFLPLKINMAGVIPAIFASAIILFPATIASWSSAGSPDSIINKIAMTLSPGQPPYIILYAFSNYIFLFLLYSTSF